MPLRKRLSSGSIVRSDSKRSHYGRISHDRYVSVFKEVVLLCELRLVAMYDERVREVDEEKRS